MILKDSESSAEEVTADVLGIAELELEVEPEEMIELLHSPEKILGWRTYGLAVGLLDTETTLAADIVSIVKMTKDF